MPRIGIIALVAACSNLGAAAQTQTRAADVACPGEPMSVYFASGESTLTAEGRQLVDRLVEQAVACKPDGVDLITRINTEVDGDSAVTLALARLSGISHDLVQRGVSPASIRVAAHPGDDIFPPGMSEVEVIFHSTAPGTGEASASKPEAQPVRPPAPGSI